VIFFMVFHLLSLPGLNSVRSIKGKSALLFEVLLFVKNMVRQANPVRRTLGKAAELYAFSP
jgi:hypothetical protein